MKLNPFKWVRVDYRDITEYNPREVTFENGVTLEVVTIEGNEYFINDTAGYYYTCRPLHEYIPNIAIKVPMEFMPESIELIEVYEFGELWNVLRGYIDDVLVEVQWYSRDFAVVKRVIEH